MPLRIVTANLFFGRVAPGTIVSLVRELAPDVLAVQELVPAVAEVLESRFAAGANVREGSGLSIGLFLSGRGRIERLPLYSNDALMARLVSGLEVITTHILAPHKLPPWTTIKRRKNDIAALVAHMERDLAVPRVLTGDLNSSPAWPAYRRLRRYLDDAPLLVTEMNGGTPDRTWGPRPGPPSLFRIDHVLTAGVRPVSTEVVDMAGSDHRAVVVDLDF